LADAGLEPEAAGDGPVDPHEMSVDQHVDRIQAGRRL
jgi:hypothetical protein